MNIFDVVIILMIVLAGAIGFKRGAIKELIYLVGICLVYVISFNLMKPLGNFLCLNFPFFNFTGILTGVVVLNVVIYQLIAFLLVAGICFSIFSVVMRLTGVLQKIVDLTIILTIPSKIIGFVLGLIEGYIVMFIVLLVLSIPFRSVSLFADSTVKNKIVYDSPTISSHVGNISNVINDVYTISEDLTQSKTSTNDLNLRLADSLLKYKVVDKNTMTSLIEKDKLNGVTGLTNIISKY